MYKQLMSTMFLEVVDQLQGASTAKVLLELVIARAKERFGNDLDTVELRRAGQALLTEYLEETAQKGSEHADAGGLALPQV